LLGSDRATGRNEIRIGLQQDRAETHVTSKMKQLGGNR
jgi:hypothetical protein